MCLLPATRLLLFEACFVFSSFFLLSPLLVFYYYFFEGSRGVPPLEHVHPLSSKPSTSKKTQEGSRERGGVGVQAPRGKNWRKMPKKIIITKIRALSVDCEERNYR